MSEAYDLISGKICPFCEEDLIIDLFWTCPKNHMKEFDILNKKICPFCNRGLIPEDKGIHSIVGFHNCPKGHMRAWYVSSGDWAGARIFFGKDKGKLSMRIFPDWDLMDICIDNNYDHLEIQQFNIFAYSIKQLRQKINTYITFS